MQLGIIGLPSVGKTTIFELLTETKEKTLNQAKANTAIAKIPDNRIDYLSKLFKPKKTTYAQLEVIDIPGLIPGADKSAAVFLDTVRKSDALLHVVRIFEDESIPTFTDGINPMKDIEGINYELLLADLDLVEKRIERINENKKKNQMLKELELLERLKEALSNEIPLSSVNLNDEEKELLYNYQFLTTKPMLICINIGEDDISNKSYPDRDKIYNYAKETGIPIVELSANIEKEITELDETEKEVFLEDLGIDESGVVKIAKGMYQRLGLISFFTVGEDEVKAWTINEGTIAKKAAGKIHSDIERGFIRAEVAEYDNLVEHGSMNALREKGLFKLEGKEYTVKDGDIIHFRFNV